MKRPSDNHLSVLEPGQAPTIQGVTRFPAQDRTNGASKIPSIIYYDKQGHVRAVGAEATRDGINIEAQEKGWVKVEWFKLHLPRESTVPATPTSAIQNDEGLDIPLPRLHPGKRAVDVYADFLFYLYTCAKGYIKETHLNGTFLWDSAKGEINYVFSHPNGWGGREQNKMREAACFAGLIHRSEADRSRLSFVTEGEASLHFCIHSGILNSKDLKSNAGFIIVDAGGGTIDISAYRRNCNEETMVFEEIAPAQCIFQGSVYVDAYAKKYLVGLLEGSNFADDVDHIVNVFQKSPKLRFKTEKDPQFIKFGGTRDNDASCNIKFGQLKLEGADVAAFFQPSVEAIVDAVLRQRVHIGQEISHVIFVGGFSENDWLFNSVSRTLTMLGSLTQVVRPEGHTRKAVADGSASFFLDHFVKTRMSKGFYGKEVATRYDSTNSEHRRRAGSAYVQADGRTYLAKHFSVILPRDKQVSEAKIFRVNSYTKVSSMESNFKRAKCDILCYKGLDINPKWIDIDADNYDVFCTVEADLSSLPSTRKTNPQGRHYYEICYDIVLFFGLTEIKAQIAWLDAEGTEMRCVFPEELLDEADKFPRGPATIVYDSPYDH